MSFYIEKLLLARTLTIASLRVQNSFVTVSELYIYIYIYIYYTRVLDYGAVCTNYGIQFGLMSMSTDY